MAKNIQESFKKIKDMDKVNSDGRMVVNTKANGSKVNNMELACTGMPRAKNVKASGMMARELHG
jgi:hypothetical protein